MNQWLAYTVFPFLNEHTQCFHSFLGRKNTVEIYSSSECEAFSTIPFAINFNYSLSRATASAELSLVSLTEYWTGTEVNSNEYPLTALRMYLSCVKVFHTDRNWLIRPACWMSPTFSTFGGTRVSCCSSSLFRDCCGGSSGCNAPAGNAGVLSLKNWVWIFLWTSDEDWTSF